MKPPVLVLHAPGTNRDRDAAWACSLAGGDPEIVTVDALLRRDRDLMSYRMLVVPGGFSFGDDLGAGRIWATVLREELGGPLSAFVDAGRPVLGICNGFQALVKAGLLPGGVDTALGPQRVTLTHNVSNRFECRWVTLAPDPDSPCVFTRELSEPIVCPVAHGEGRLVVGDDAMATHLAQRHLGALRYVAPDGGKPAYPHNPNGSHDDIAGLTNLRGNVLGLMPHPEDHIFPRQHPRAHRGEGGGSGLALFQAGVRHAAACG